MRPPVGYKNISYVIVPVKSYMTGFQMFTAYGAVTSIGLYIYYLNAKLIQGEYIEIRLAQNVLFPVLIVERYPLPAMQKLFCENIEVEDVVIGITTKALSRSDLYIFFCALSCGMTKKVIPLTNRNLTHDKHLTT
uniref:NADH dehydrogenase [ubiquinone] 1 alpha subcomplex subunit 13 n=1 Tax=Glossina austeni TaxID=7395 RepID=A0A1A9VP69_GLOAU